MKTHRLLLPVATIAAVALVSACSSSQPHRAAAAAPHPASRSASSSAPASPPASPSPAGTLDSDQEKARVTAVFDTLGSQVSAASTVPQAVGEMHTAATQLRTLAGSAASSSTGGAVSTLAGDVTQMASDLAADPTPRSSTEPASIKADQVKLQADAEDLGVTVQLGQ